MRLLLLCTAQLAFAASLVFAATPSRGHGTLQNRGAARLHPRAASATIRSDTSATATMPPTGHRRGILQERDTPPSSSSACTQTVSSTVVVTSTSTSYTTINVTSTTTLTTAAAATATYSANAVSTFSCDCPSSTAAAGGSEISSGAWSSGAAGTGNIAGTNSMTGTSSGPREGALPTSSFPAADRRSWVRRDGCVCSSVTVSVAPSTSSAAPVATNPATATGSSGCCSAGSNTNSAWEGALPTSSFPAIGRRANKRDDCSCSGSATGSASAMTGASGATGDATGTATVANHTSASAAASASASAACTPGWGVVNMVANLYTTIVANVTTNNSDPCTWGYGTTSLNRTCNSASWAFVYNIYATSDSWESTEPTNSAACVLSGVGTDELNAPVITVYNQEPFLTVYPNNSGISVTCS